MDLLHLARLEFAVTASVHFLFVATALGLAPVVACYATRHAVTGDPRHGRLTDYVMRLYLVNYGIGIVSGLLMELQMGMNWAGDGTALYDPVASTLAVETVFAFFLESTFIGLFLASAGRFPQWLRALLVWGAALTAWASAVIVVSANAFLHRPVGITTGPDGTVEVTNLLALLGNPSAVSAWLHILGAAGITAGFWLAAGGARLALLRLDRPVATSLLRTGTLLVSLAAPFTVISGFTQFAFARDLSAQPAAAGAAGAFGLLLALMMLAGLLITLLTWAVLLPLALTGALIRARALLHLIAGAAWIPLVIAVFGWIYREEARQPWFVVGHVTVAQAASLDGPVLAGSATVFTVLAVLVGAVNFVLLGRSLRCDPARAGFLPADTSRPSPPDHLVLS